MSQEILQVALAKQHYQSPNGGISWLIETFHCDSRCYCEGEYQFFYRSFPPYEIDFEGMAELADCGITYNPAYGISNCFERHVNGDYDSFFRDLNTIYDLIDRFETKAKIRWEAAFGR
mgnify:CR=1 FL=1